LSTRWDRRAGPALAAVAVYGLSRRIVEIGPGMQSHDQPHRPRRAALLAIIGTALLSCLADATAQTPVPLPHPRPEAAGPRASPPPAATTPEKVDENGKSEVPDEAAACLGRLRAAGIRFDIPTMPAAANTACAIEVPVRLQSVRSRSRGGADIRLSDQPVVSCRFAERFSGWLGELAAPLIAGRLSAEVAAVRTGPGYECRNRNRATTGKLSAHAVGQAVDVAGFELSNGKTMHVKPDGDEAMQAAVGAIRSAACGWFTTVLGPGSDAAHTDHMHVDIMQHGPSDRYRICQ